MPRFEVLDWYDAPQYYDIIFDTDTAKEVDFLEGLLARHGQAKTRAQRSVLEPACGSGRFLVEFARRGWLVEGFDASRPMLDYAAQRLGQAGLAGVLREGRMEAFSSRRRHELVHCLVSTFKYLLSEEHARGFLSSAAEVLLDGGLLALGFHLTQYDYDEVDVERWRGQRGGARVACTIEGWPADRRRRLERCRSRLLVEEGGRKRRLETEWTFRTYDARQTRRLLASVPELEHVATYDFTYDLGAPRDLDDRQLDTLLVLRRRPRRE
jgi:SAM-dependent methyltransferase